MILLRRVDWILLYLESTITYLRSPLGVKLADLPALFSGS